MARTLSIGFELNSIDYETDGVGGIGLPVISATQARTGTYSLRCTSISGVASFNVPSLTELYFGFGGYFENLLLQGPIFEIYGVAGDLAFLRVNAGGTIEAMRGATSLDTSGATLSEDDWHYFEVHYIAHDAAGEFTVRVNGDEWLTFTGDTIDTGDLDVKSIRFLANTANIYYDDLVINDTTTADNNTWPGQPRLSLATVNGDGDDSDWTPTAGNNFQTVDEVPPNTTDYVYSGTPTDVDLYDITDPLAGTEIINNVIVTAIAQIDSGSGNMALTVKSNVTEDDGDTEALTEAWTRYQHCWPDNPDDAAAWEPADIDDLQIGQEVKA